jgi:dimethylhistidine N-methyltransferase
MSQFANDVRAGLERPDRRLSSKYFYDDEGSQIFQEIMAMPEYFLTDAEMDVFCNQSKEILSATGFTGPFNVVELGAGDGVKTQHMLKAFLEEGAQIVYRPIDISAKAVEIVQQRLNFELPDLAVKPEIGDYFEQMQAIKSSDVPSLILFLGSNIGNYVPPENLHLIRLIAEHMGQGDQLIIGADLRKDPNMIRRAYDDSEGITKRFNLNLLKRINRELGGDFKLDTWDFYCSYNPMNGEVRSYLMSKEKQEVYIEALGQKFSFGRYELIWTELSKKYSLDELTGLCSEAGLAHKGHFLDSKQHFTDSLFVRT